MKLSFTTRGWSSLSFQEVTDIADELKFSGFELYDLFKHLRKKLEQTPTIMIIIQVLTKNNYVFGQFISQNLKTDENGTILYKQQGVNLT